jgi:hypothetical protein
MCCGGALLGRVGGVGAEAAACGVEDPVYLYLRSEEGDLRACGSHPDAAGAWRSRWVCDFGVVRMEAPGETSEWRWRSRRRRHIASVPSLEESLRSIYLPPPSPG